MPKRQLTHFAGKVRMSKAGFQGGTVSCSAEMRALGSCGIDTTAGEFFAALRSLDEDVHATTPAPAVYMSVGCESPAPFSGGSEPTSGGPQLQTAEHGDVMPGGLNGRVWRI